MEDEVYKGKMSHLLLGGDETSWVIPKFETVSAELHNVLHDLKGWVKVMIGQKTDLSEDAIFGIQPSNKEGYYLIQCHSSVMLDIVWQDLWKSLKLSWMLRSSTLGMAEDMDEASIPFPDKED